MSIECTYIVSRLLLDTQTCVFVVFQACHQLSHRHARLAGRLSQRNADVGGHRQCILPETAVLPVCRVPHQIKCQPGSKYMIDCWCQKFSDARSMLCEWALKLTVYRELNSTLLFIHCFESCYTNGVNKSIWSIFLSTLHGWNCFPESLLYFMNFTTSWIKCFPSQALTACCNSLVSNIILCFACYS